MKYRDLPRVRPKKGVGRKMRSQVARITRQIFDDLGPQLRHTINKAYLDSLIFGESQVRVSWDSEAGIAVTNEPRA